MLLIGTALKVNSGKSVADYHALKGKEGVFCVLLITYTGAYISS